MGKPTQEKTERNRKIYELRMSGETLQRIGNKYKLTRERVRQIVDKYKAKMDVCK